MDKKALKQRIKKALEELFWKVDGAEKEVYVFDDFRREFLELSGLESYKELFDLINNDNDFFITELSEEEKYTLTLLFSIGVDNREEQLVREVYEKTFKYKYSPEALLKIMNNKSTSSEPGKKVLDLKVRVLKTKDDLERMVKELENQKVLYYAGKYKNNLQKFIDEQKKNDAYHIDSGVAISGSVTYQSRDIDKKLDDMVDKAIDEALKRTRHSLLILSKNESHDSNGVITKYDFVFPNINPYGEHFALNPKNFKMLKNSIYVYSGLEGKYDMLPSMQKNNKLKAEIADKVIKTSKIHGIEMQDMDVFLLSFATYMREKKEEVYADTSLSEEEKKQKALEVEKEFLTYLENKLNEVGMAIEEEFKKNEIFI